MQPQSVIGNSVISPFLCLSAVFYWSLHRQGHFYVVTLIILGIISDILIGASLGFTPILFLTVFAISILAEKKCVIETFLLDLGCLQFDFWTCVCNRMGNNLLVSLQYADIGPFAIQYFMTVISFPILDCLLSHIQRALAV